VNVWGSVIDLLNNENAIRVLSHNQLTRYRTRNTMNLGGDSPHTLMRFDNTQMMYIRSKVIIDSWRSFVQGEIDACNLRGVLTSSK
jgi:hypothetical protein